MSKYTPGPWKWWTSNSWRRLMATAAGGLDEPVLIPYNARSDGHPDCDVSEADMRLIAAAPEMLEALRSVIEIADGGDFGHVLTFESIRALIARIENDD